MPSAPKSPEITIVVNGERRSIALSPDRSLLYVLREELDLTGTKYGCGEGECGACTVLLDGVAARSCVTPVSETAGRDVTTIEGLLPDGQGGLHPVAAAFLDVGAFQCGFCTPGMIMSAVGLLAHSPHPGPGEIEEALNGNICRCCGYARIVEAVRRAADLRELPRMAKR